MPLPCLKPRRSSKVCPAPNSSNDVDLVEVRKGRMLRIQHINPRLRNKQLPQSKHGKTQAPPAQPLELHVPRVSFYGNKFIVKEAPSPISNHVKNSGGGPSPNNHRVSPHVTGQNNNGGRGVKSNAFPTNLSKEQKRMLFKMGVRSVSALKNMVLFFFHGVGGSSDIWQTQINYFSSLGFEIVAPDLIGHGMSEVPLKKRAYHFREILADVLAIFDRYCKKKNLVIGHSYGCAFTTVLARERARRVWRLIMISGGGPIPLAPEIGIFAFPLWFVSCIRPCLDQVFEKSAFKKKRKNEMLKRASFGVPSFVLHYVINGQDWPDGDETYHSWISVPTLLINGREDTFATLDDAKLMKATIHGSRLEIVEEASHMVMLEAPDKVNKLILDFICSRGSHKLPDVKETAEEGVESPRKVSPTCCYSTTGQKPIHPLHLHHHQHAHANPYGHGHSHSHEESARTTPNQSPRSSKVAPQRPKSPPQIDGWKSTKEDEDVSSTPKRNVDQLAVAQRSDSTTPVLKWARRPTRGSSYDNASYESDESGEEYYYYKDEFGNHHYISSKEYTRQFPNTELPPASYQATDMLPEMSIVDIPAFEDISTDVSLDGTMSGSPDYSSRSYPVEVNAKYPNNSERSPEYIGPRGLYQSNNKFDSYDMSGSSDSPRASREMNMNRAPRFSVPELLFCEECIRKKDNAERTTNCERCINLNMAAVGYRERQNSLTRRQSVALALGRQGSDSLDYLGQEQLIIITCYDETEEEEISASSSSTDQQGNQRATRHGQRSSIQESGDDIRKKPSLPPLDEQDEYSPSPVMKARGGRREIGPVKKQHTLNDDLVSNLHKELLAKVNKRNSANEERHVPKEGKTKMNVKSSLVSEPSTDEGVVHRTASFLESKKLMEAHFSKTAFPLPRMHMSARGSPNVAPSNKVPPKVLAPKPERSRAQLRSEPSEERVISSSPSFSQSRKAIHAHFSKVGLGSPMARPFSSPNLGDLGRESDIRAISPQRDRKLSNSSPSTLAKPRSRSEESLDPDEEITITRRLSVTEWADKHVKRLGELMSPGKSEDPTESSESLAARSNRRASRSGSSGSGSLLGISEWAEKHAKRITEAISPPGTPNKAAQKENVGSTRSLAEHEDSDEETRPVSSLSLNDWADRHLKMIASRMSPSRSAPELSKEDTRASPEKEASVTESVNTLSVNDWAQRHLQKIAEMQKTAQNDNGNVPKPTTPSKNVIVGPKSPAKEPGTTDEGTDTGSSLSLNDWANRHLKMVASRMSSPPVSNQNDSPFKEASTPKVAEGVQNISRMELPKSTMSSGDGSLKEKVKSSQDPVTKTLSLNEWAEKHVRKIDEVNSRSPKTVPKKDSDGQSSPVYEYTLIRTPIRTGHSNNRALNEWAEKHVRRQSEDKLIFGSIKEEKTVEKDNKNKVEEKVISNVPAINESIETPMIPSNQRSPLRRSSGGVLAVDQGNDTAEAEKRKTIATTKDKNEVEKKESEGDSKVCNYGASQKIQETHSSGQTSFSNKLSLGEIPEIRMAVPDIDSDSQLMSSCETLTDSSPEEPLRSVSRRLSGSPAPLSDVVSKLPDTPKGQSRSVRQESSPLRSPARAPMSKESKETEYLKNNVANNNNNNNNNNNAEHRVRLASTTFDSNSNVVASTSVSPQEDNKDQGDKDRASSEGQQSITTASKPNQSNETPGTPTDNDNNRIVPHSTPVTTSNTEPPTNVSNALPTTPPHTIV